MCWVYRRRGWPSGSPTCEFWVLDTFWSQTTLMVCLRRLWMVESARETSPLSVAYDGFSSITVVPWPSLEDDRDECDPGRVEASIIKESNATSTTQSLFGRPAQYAAQNTCHRRLVAAGADWVTHMDVDEFLVPPPSLNAEQYLMELLTPFGERRLPPRALALPCVFFAPCRMDGHGSAGRSIRQDAVSRGDLRGQGATP